MTNPHWTAYVSALMVPTLAIIAAYIGYRQWRTAQNKLKLDLFEKRMLVYQAARDMLGYVASHANSSPEEQFKYIRGIQSAKWLFGPEVFVYLNELWKKVNDLELHRSVVYDGLSDDPDRQKHVVLKAETLNWLVGQYEVLDKKCAKYLSLEH